MINIYHINPTMKSKENPIPFPITPQFSSMIGNGWGSMMVQEIPERMKANIPKSYLDKLKKAAEDRGEKYNTLEYVRYAEFMQVFGFFNLETMELDSARIEDFFYPFRAENLNAIRLSQGINDDPSTSQLILNWFEHSILNNLLSRLQEGEKTPGNPHVKFTNQGKLGIAMPGQVQDQEVTEWDVIHKLQLTKSICNGTLMFLQKQNEYREVDHKPYNIEVNAATTIFDNLRFLAESKIHHSFNPDGTDKYKDYRESKLAVFGKLQIINYMDQIVQRARSKNANEIKNLMKGFEFSIKNEV